MFAAILLAASVVENAVIQSPQLGTFFALPQWMPTVVGLDRTPGSIGATNMTHRLDPTALASVNACFEAYCERVYFGYAGPSNVWDAAQYGPTCRYSDKHLFRFALPTNAPSPFVYAPDTNRVIETRRLVEYGNLKSLADVMRTDDFMTIERPGWWRHNGYTGWYWNTDPNVMWSSTLFDGLETNYGTAGSPFPIVAWSDPATFLSSQGSKKWFDTALGWPHPDNGSVLEWWSQYGSGYNVADLAADEVNFGEPAMTDNREDYMYSGEINLTNTADSIVGEGFVKYDVKTVTLTNVIELSVSDVFNDGEPVFDEICDEAATYYYGCYAVMSIEYADLENPTNLHVQIDVDFEGQGGIGYLGTASIGKIESTTEPQVSVEPNDVEISFSVVEQDGERRVEWSPEDAPDTCAGVVSIVYTVEMTNAVVRCIGVEGLTNDTRRLYTDRLAGLGLTLGALDRTFAHLASPIPSVVTQYHHTASKHYTSEVDVSHTDFTWDGSEWLADIADQDIPTLSFDHSTTNSYATGWAQVDGRYVKYVTDIQLTHTEGTSLEAENQNVLLSREAFENAIPPFETDGMFLVELVNAVYDGVSVVIQGNLYIKLDGQTTMTEPFDLRIPSEPHAFESNATITVSLSTHTQYGSGHTTGSPCWGPNNMPYPGDYSRVSHTSYPMLWSMNGAASLRGHAGHGISLSEALAVANYDSSHSGYHSSCYSTSRGTHTSGLSLLNLETSMYQSLVGKCCEMFAAEMGAAFDPFDPLANLTTVERGIREANTLSGLELKGASVVASFESIVGQPEGIYDHTRRLRYIDGSFRNGVTFAETFTFVKDGEMESERAAFPVTVAYWTFTVRGEPSIRDGYEPQNTDLYGVKVNGKMSPWSKVDWDWKALKRTKNAN